MLFLSVAICIVKAVIASIVRIADCADFSDFSERSSDCVKIQISNSGIAGKGLLMETINLKIPKIPNDPNPIDIPLKNGDQLFIVGPNGSGKSALIQRFVSQLPPDRVKRITAHRQTWFNSGSIDLTPANRQQHEQQNLNYDRSHEARWKDFNPGWHLSAVLFDLVAKENTRAPRYCSSC